VPPPGRPNQASLVCVGGPLGERRGPSPLCFGESLPEQLGQHQREYLAALLSAPRAQCDLGSGAGGALPALGIDISDGLLAEPAGIWLLPAVWRCISKQ